MLHRFAVLTAIFTFPLIFAGATVTTKDAALAVPDWPLSFGGLFPPMVGNILYEHGHRILAGLVGLLTMILAVWIQRAERRNWVKIMGWSAVAAVLVQATLGGLTVLNLRSPLLSSLHACLAQAFFALLASIALVTSPRWHGTGEPASALPGRSAPAMKLLSLLVVVTVLIQLGLGAAVRHLEAVVSIPDFPLSFGRLFPPAEKLQDPGVAVHFAHRCGAVLVFLVGIPFAIRCLRLRVRRIRTPSVVLLTLLPLQALLGATTVWTRQGFVPSTLHVVTGALILVTAVILAIQTHLSLSVEPGRGVVPEVFGGTKKEALA